MGVGSSVGETRGVHSVKSSMWESQETSVLGLFIFLRENMVHDQITVAGDVDFGGKALSTLFWMSAGSAT